MVISFASCSFGKHYPYSAICVAVQSALGVFYVIYRYVRSPDCFLLCHFSDGSIPKTFETEQRRLTSPQGCVTRACSLDLPPPFPVLTFASPTRLQAHKPMHFQVQRLPLNNTLPKSPRGCHATSLLKTFV